MASARCPHCQAALPEAATFCAACGRRIAGWSATPGGGNNNDPLPGGEEPTRQMEPTPSLLRAAAATAKKKSGDDSEPATSKFNATKKTVNGRAVKRPAGAGPVETDSALMRAVKHRRAPLVIALGLLGIGAAAGAFFLVSRYGRNAPPAAAPPAVAAPPVVVKPPIAPPAAAPVKSARRSKGPHRVEPLTIAAAPGRATGGLPHKTVRTDSASLAPAAAKNPPAATANPPAPAAAKNSAPPAAAAPPAQPEDLPSEAAPLTDDEMKSQAEASIDADQVRFVVKQHLAQVHACYQRAFKEESPGGRVELAFTIGRDGRVAKARADTNSTGSDLLGRCLEGRIKEWQFPRPTGGEYELIYPFVFAPGS